jgi:hypothetical protein
MILSEHFSKSKTGSSNENYQDNNNMVCISDSLDSE